MHHSDVIMGAMASQITSLAIVYSTVYSGADQRKHQSSASLAFVRGIHRWPVNSPHKGPVTGKCFHLMTSSWLCVYIHVLFVWRSSHSRVPMAVPSLGEDSCKHHDGIDQSVHITGAPRDKNKQNHIWLVDCDISSRKVSHKDSKKMDGRGENSQRGISHSSF